MLNKMHKEVLIENIDKIHTTEMGVGRMQKNLEITEEPVSYCISKLQKKILQLLKRVKITISKLMTVE